MYCKILRLHTPCWEQDNPEPLAGPGEFQSGHLTSSREILSSLRLMWEKSFLMTLLLRPYNIKTPRPLKITYYHIPHLARLMLMLGGGGCNIREKGFHQNQRMEIIALAKLVPRLSSSRSIPKQYESPILTSRCSRKPPALNP